MAEMGTEAASWGRGHCAGLGSLPAPRWTKGTGRTGGIRALSTNQ